MKKFMMMTALVVLTATAMAIPPSMKPPITTGGKNSSSTEVRITANVVQGVAVNEASPIDFGNLPKGIFEAPVSAEDYGSNGAIIVKGANGGDVNLRADKVSGITLGWKKFNGSPDDGTRTEITDVTVTGITNADVAHTLSGTGELRRELGAYFTAGKAANQNLGTDQKLGAYQGSITITATVV